MAGEGAGLGWGGAASSALGGVLKLAGAFRRGRSHSELLAHGQAWAASQAATQASPAVERPNVALPRTAALYGLASGLVAPQPSSAPPRAPQPPPQPAQQPAQLGDFIDAAQRGLARGLEIAALIEAIRALFQKPPKIPAPQFYVLGGDTVPYSFAPSTFASGTDFLTGAGSLASGIASVINAIRSPSNMPGGMSFLPTATIGGIARVAGGLATGAGLGAAAMELFQGSGGGCPTSPFTAGTAGARPTIFVAANPVTGRATWFRPAGRPILWSSDLSACRRVRKVAGRARRRLGGR